MRTATNRTRPPLPPLDVFKDMKEQCKVSSVSPRTPSSLSSTSPLSALKKTPERGLNSATTGLTLPHASRMPLESGHIRIVSWPRYRGRSLSVSTPVLSSDPAAKAEPLSPVVTSVLSSEQVAKVDPVSPAAASGLSSDSSQINFKNNIALKESVLRSYLRTNMGVGDTVEAYFKHRPDLEEEVLDAYNAKYRDFVHQEREKGASQGAEISVS